MAVRQSLLIQNPAFVIRVLPRDSLYLTPLADGKADQALIQHPLYLGGIFAMDGFRRVLEFPHLLHKAVCGLVWPWLCRPLRVVFQKRFVFLGGENLLGLRRWSVGRAKRLPGHLSFTGKVLLHPPALTFLLAVQRSDQQIQVVFHKVGQVSAVLRAQDFPHALVVPVILLSDHAGYGNVTEEIVAAAQKHGGRDHP